MIKKDKQPINASQAPSLQGRMTLKQRNQTTQKERLQQRGEMEKAKKNATSHRDVNQQPAFKDHTDSEFSLDDGNDSQEQSQTKPASRNGWIIGSKSSGAQKAITPSMRLQEKQSQRQQFTPKNRNAGARSTVNPSGRSNNLQTSKMYKDYLKQIHELAKNKSTISQVPVQRRRSFVNTNEMSHFASQVRPDQPEMHNVLLKNIVSNHGPNAVVETPNEVEYESYSRSGPRVSQRRDEESKPKTSTLQTASFRNRNDWSREQNSMPIQDHSRLNNTLTQKSHDKSFQPSSQIDSRLAHNVIPSQRTPNINISLRDYRSSSNKSSRGNFAQKQRFYQIYNQDTISNNYQSIGHFAAASQDSKDFSEQDNEYDVNGYQMQNEDVSVPRQSRIQMYNNKPQMKNAFNTMQSVVEQTGQSDDVSNSKQSRSLAANGSLRAVNSRNRRRQELDNLSRVSRVSNVSKPSRVLYPYDYGYNPDPENTSRVSINVQPGENLYSLGGKIPEIQEQQIPEVGLEMDNSQQELGMATIDEHMSSSEAHSKTISKDKKSKQVSLVSNPESVFKRRDGSIYAPYQPDFDPCEYMKNNLIFCRKYNYSVPKSFDDYKAVIYIGGEKDEKTIKIYKVNQEEEDKFIKLKDLRFSIQIKDIKGFIYGSFSTRFWMMRIGMNQLINDKLKIKHKLGQMQNTEVAETKKDEGDADTQSEKEKKEKKEAANKKKRDLDLPFYAWECITLLTDEREYDLVIGSGEDMHIFIQFLILKLKTYNGKTNSVNDLKQRKLIPRNVSMNQLMHPIYRTFFIMKLRMKISYEACKTNRTIQEMFLFAILKTYHQRKSKGLIKNPFPKITQKIIDGVKGASLKAISQNNLMEEAKGAQNAKVFRSAHTAIGKNSNGQYADVMASIKNIKTVQLLNIMTAQAMDSNRIDDIFEKHFTLDDEDHLKNFLVTKAVRIAEVQMVGGQKIIELDKFQEVNSSSDDNSESDLKDAEKFMQKRRKKFIIQKKLQLTDQKLQLSKMNLLIRLRLVNGPLYIYVLLETIKLSKQILILELEQGKEATVPKCLGLKHLPLTFQYYDSIIETCRKNMSNDQKHFIQNADLLNLHQFDVQKKQIEKEQPVLFEKVAQQWKKHTKKKEQKIRYIEKLKMFEKSRSVQTARYVQLDHHHLRVNHHLCESQMLEITKTRCKDERDIATSYPMEVEQLKDLRKELIDDPGVTCDVNYLTHRQVGRKRATFFNKKYQYQSQLMGLKSKGNRLLQCERLQAIQLEEARKLILLNEYGTTEFRPEHLQNRQLEMKIQKYIRAETACCGENPVKKSIVMMIDMLKEFDEHGIVHQEQGVLSSRKCLYNSVKAIKEFNNKTKFIDQKIEYDNRFFCEGYTEFQLMISDIRKQVRLNNEIQKLKQTLNIICNDIHQTSTNENANLNHLIEKKNHRTQIEQQYYVKKAQLQKAKNHMSKTSKEILSEFEKKATLHKNRGRSNSVSSRMNSDENKINDIRSERNSQNGNKAKTQVLEIEQYGKTNVNLRSGAKTETTQDSAFSQKVGNSKVQNQETIKRWQCEENSIIQEEEDSIGGQNIQELGRKIQKNPNVSNGSSNLSGKQLQDYNTIMKKLSKMSLQSGGTESNGNAEFCQQFQNMGLFQKLSSAVKAIDEDDVRKEMIESIQAQIQRRRSSINEITKGLKVDALWGGSKRPHPQGKSGQPTPKSTPKRKEQQNSTQGNKNAQYVDEFSIQDSDDD